jgi:hypothetical protein
MYFGRNSYDPDAVREAQTRLQSFQGATAISSNQYFGRDEEEEERGRLGSGSDGSLLGDGSSLAGLETAARDAVARVLSNPDVQNVGESIRTGALKVCAAFLFFCVCALFDKLLKNSFLTTWLQCLNVHDDFSGTFITVLLFSFLCGYFDRRGNICPINGQ